MVKDGIELVNVTNQFKFEAPDRKLQTSDALMELITPITMNWSRR